MLNVPEPVGISGQQEDNRGQASNTLKTIIANKYIHVSTKCPPPSQWLCVITICCSRQQFIHLCTVSRLSSVCHKGGSHFLNFLAILNLTWNSVWVGKKMNKGLTETAQRFFHIIIICTNSNLTHCIGTVPTHEICCYSSA